MRKSDQVRAAAAGGGTLSAARHPPAEPCPRHRVPPPRLRSSPIGLSQPHTLAAPRAVRDEAKGLKKDYDKTEDDLKALQSVGQIIGEVLRQLDEERCALPRQHTS